MNGMDNPCFKGYNIIIESKEFPMNIENIHTINDFMVAVGEALSEGDGDTLMNLQDLVRGWMQTGEETDAQERLLTGALDAIGW